MNLRRSRLHDDWVALDGATYGTPEGPIDQWVQVFAAIETRSRFFAGSRLAVDPQPDGSVVFWSPRTRTGPDDQVRVFALEIHFLRPDFLRLSHEIQTEKATIPAR
jgi:hypothetical protein